ncbi:hypothetical protein V1264_002811 [Littorina saxatilis]|uniref:Uncharacterized protein n=2 Tax=Littorina saxatilis TaxID=31220 RepID=A0AAN9B3N9_9CAEN
MDGQSVSTCKEFQECMGNAEMPIRDAGLVSVDSWCDVSAQTMECVRLLSERCTVPSTLNASVSNIYEELLNEGCPNTFDFQTAEDPTGGTGPLAGISTTYLLLLTLVANLIFLV